MLRKALYVFVALAVSVLVLLGFDCARHAMAIGRLEKKGAVLDHWRYRLLERPMAWSVDSQASVLGRLQRCVVHPQVVNLNAVPLNESLTRDLDVAGVETLYLSDCPDFPTDFVRQLGSCRSIRVLGVAHSGLSNDVLNLFWSGMPNLEDVDINSYNTNLISDDGFSEIKQARKLKRLALAGPPIGRHVIARLCEAPALEVLILWDARVSEESAAALAAMPSLRSLIFVTESLDDKVLAVFQRQNPHLKVEVMAPFRSPRPPPKGW